MAISWPEGKRFAFTIFDDTDLATEENVQDVYALLAELGFRTTKSVWPLKGKEKPLIGGSTCEDPAYLRWLYRLQKMDFEIGYHLATYHSSTRDETIRGIDRFKELFGHDPISMANHADCIESMYWGNHRLTGINSVLYDVQTQFRNRGRFRGHIEGDRHFWGDVCRERVMYVRNFVFKDINTLKACRFMPYYDEDRPYVRQWFASSEGADVRSFVSTVSERNQDRLEAEGGACIMYTHFAKGFFDNGALHAGFRELMHKLSVRNGWFVPVATLLDYIVSMRGPYTIARDEKLALERKWLWHKTVAGPT